MESALNNFAKRQEAVRRKHARLAKGYVTRLDQNGTFVQVPDSKSGSTAVRLAMWLVIAVVVFKAFLLAGLGSEVYQAHVDALVLGGTADRIGAVIMQPDPVSMTLAKVAISLLG